MSKERIRGNIESKLEAKTIRDGEVIWSTQKGEEMIHMVWKSQGMEGIDITFAPNAAPNIVKEMEIFDDGDNMIKRINKKDKTKFTFHVERNNNPNLQWRDLKINIDQIINSPSKLGKK